MKKVSAQKEGALADSQHKARFLTFVRNDKRCCHFDRREKSLAPGIIEFPRIIEWILHVHVDVHVGVEVDVDVDVGVGVVWAV